ncbi:MAG: LysR family transcriptional regulator [Burkholderiaceae bacterium]|nr:LysR family transcriptional regulator [Burkholderiaceae bacterium]
MSLRFVKSFVATAELGSFAKAAEALFVTQAAIAARVAKLEEELGVMLFRREGSSLHLTEQGQQALAAARNLAAQADQFLQQVRDPRLTAGTLRVAWTGFVSHLLQPALVLELQRRHPQLGLEFQTLSSLEVIDSLAEGRADLAISVGVQARRRWLSMPLFDLALRWVASTRMFPAGQRVELADITARPVITYPVGTLPYQATLRQLQPLGRALPPLVVVDTVADALTLTAAGVGSCVLPPVVIRDALVAGTLRELDVPPPLTGLSFHAAYRDHGDGAGLCAGVCQLISDLARLRLEGDAAATRLSG